MIVRRVEALGKFLDTDDGKNLLAGVKRAATSCASRRRRTTRAIPARRTQALLSEPEEKALAEAVATAKKEASAAVAKEDFAAAMSAMAKLRPHVDAFFDKVTVNADDTNRARKSAEAAQRNSRSDPRGGGFLQDRR